MKEATGELNMTVVTVVAIAAVGVFFYIFVWPAIQNNLLANTYCASAFGCECGDDKKKCKCNYYTSPTGEETGTVYCDRSGNNG